MGINSTDLFSTFGGISSILALILVTCDYLDKTVSSNLKNDVVSLILFYGTSDYKKIIEKTNLTFVSIFENLFFERKHSRVNGFLWQSIFICYCMTSSLFYYVHRYRLLYRLDFVLIHMFLLVLCLCIIWAIFDWIFHRLLASKIGSIVYWVGMSTITIVVTNELQLYVPPIRYLFPTETPIDTIYSFNNILWLFILILPFFIILFFQFIIETHFIDTEISIFRSMFVSLSSILITSIIAQLFLGIPLLQNSANSFIYSPNFISYVFLNLVADPLSLLETYYILRLAINKSLSIHLVLFMLDLLLSGFIFSLIPLFIGDYSFFSNAFFFRGDRAWAGVFFWATYFTSIIFWLYFSSLIFLKLLNSLLKKYLKLESAFPIRSKPFISMGLASIPIVTFILLFFYILTSNF